MMDQPVIDWRFNMPGVTRQNNIKMLNAVKTTAVLVIALRGLFAAYEEHYTGAAITLSAAFLYEPAYEKISYLLDKCTGGDLSSVATAHTTFFGKVGYAAINKSTKAIESAFDYVQTVDESVSNFVFGA
jgi:hypothetical protein